MTDEEFEREMGDDNESLHYPSDEDDEDENEGNVTVPDLEDDTLGDADVHMSEERVP